jgi:hypothetical protein
MNNYSVSEGELLDNIQDINSGKIPSQILEEFFKIKEEIGSLPMGISFIQDKGYFFIDTSANIYKYYSITLD